jgi:hypothetical protein
MNREQIAQEWDRLATPLHRQRFLGLIALGGRPTIEAQRLVNASFCPWEMLSVIEQATIIEWIEAKHASEELTNGN